MNTVDIFSKLGREAKRVWIREHKKQCAEYPDHMKEEPVPEHMQGRVLGTWRSRTHLAVAWAVPGTDGGMFRLTVNRTFLNEDTGAWLDGISWDDLQRIKSECGFGDRQAIEIYPKDGKVVNVSNMRHLWVLGEELPVEFDLGGGAE